MTLNNAPNADRPKPDTARDIDDVPSLRHLVHDAWQDAVDGSRPVLVPAAIVAGAVCGLVLLAVLVHAAINAGADRTVVTLARTVTGPVHSYLATHATGLPFSPAALMIGWYAAGGTLLLLSTVFAARGARIGWALFGLASAAMVYAATPHPRQWIAVGIAGAWWTLLSIPALARRPADTCHHIVVHTHDQPCDDQA